MESALDMIKACLEPCFPMNQAKKAASPSYRANHYNNQLRANLGLPEREYELPHLVLPASTISGFIAASSPPPPPVPPKNSTVDLVAVQTHKAGQKSPPRVKPQRRLPANVALAPGTRPAWATMYMDKNELAELFNLLHSALGHIPYAICGLGCLIDQYGFTRRRANKISILCPAHSKDTVKSWAFTAGYPTYADSVGLPIPSTGAVRRVRIKYIDTGFDQLDRVKSSFSNATVLSLSSQLDNIAAGWLERRARGDERALKTIASDVWFCLSYLSETRQTVNPLYLPTFLGEDFFSSFTSLHPQARPEMARAGIDVSSVLARHRDAQNLREHDTMLKQFGMEGDVVVTQPQPFETMRDLTNSKSVYTLRNRDSTQTAPSELRPESMAITEVIPNLPDVPEVKKVSGRKRDEEKKLPPLPRSRSKSPVSNNPLAPEKGKMSAKSKPKLTRKWNSVKETPGSRKTSKVEYPVGVSGLTRSLTDRR
ncbi:hypothetical protein F5Y16DRAFT_373229 [Xylariaceae sp. FL0255]|nr:hypothetical protein F5Y16DRAFT_373229 [Xylariaceae sp. FL0255]